MYARQPLFHKRDDPSSAPTSMGDEKHPPHIVHVPNAARGWSSFL